MSQEAEEALLGAVLLNNKAYLSVAAFLNAEDFFIKRNEYIWTVFTRLYDRGEPIDNVTIARELEALGWLQEIGGPPYITNLVNNTPSAMHAEIYGELVSRAATRRRMLQAADSIRNTALDEELPIDKVISDAEHALMTVTNTQLKREFVPLWDAASDYYDEFERLLSLGTGTVGTPSGFKALDGLLGGFQRSDLVVFAGRPGMGKTSWMLTVALYVARLGARVAIFTMEMGVEQLVQRIISMETGIRIQQAAQCRSQRRRADAPRRSHQPHLQSAALHR